MFGILDDIWDVGTEIIGNVFDKAVDRAPDMILNAAGDIGQQAISNEMAMDRQTQAQGFNREERMASQDFNSAQAIAQRAWASEQADKAREWDARLSNTAIQRRMQDLTAAGVNPLLAIAQGGASTPGTHIPSGASASAGMASSGIANPTPFTGVAAGLASATQARLNERSAELREAEAERTRAETKEIEERTKTYDPHIREVEERTKTYAVNIDHTRQQISESEQRIKKIIQETETSAATATNLAQQTRNLQETIPVLQQTLQHLKAMTSTSWTQGDLNKAQTAEIKQRVASNLPRLEAAVKELERQARQIQQPRLEMETSVTGHGFIGALGATLRALNPFADFLQKR